MACFMRRGFWMVDGWDGMTVCIAFTSHRIASHRFVLIYYRPAELLSLPAWKRDAMQ